MKERLLTNWHMLRWLRLIAGIAIAAQALYLKEWMLFVAGIIFAAIALFHGGCCAGYDCNNYNSSIVKNEKETEYEEVV
jgi:hypothetical protein